MISKNGQSRDTGNLNKPNQRQIKKQKTKIKKNKRKTNTR